MIKAVQVIIVLCFVTLSTNVIPFAYAQDGKFLDIQSVSSESGINAWLVEDHSLPIISMSFSFRGAGAKNDPADKQGLSMMASNTMDEGAGDIKSQDFQQALKDNSITLYFNSWRDDFGGTLKTLTNNKAKAFELLNLALTKPRFDEEPVERMRASNKSRIKSSLSDPNWIAARIQNDRIYEGHPYSMNSGGTLSSLNSITPKDLREFHSRLGRNQLIIAVAGDITAEELKATIEEIFGSLPITKTVNNDKITSKNAGKTYLYEQNIPQTIIEMSQEGISRKDKDFYSAYLMNFILGGSGFGSHLMEEIREKRGLTYGIYSYFQHMQEADMLKVSTSTANKNVPEMLSLIREEWDKMKETTVSDKELSEAKSYIIGSMPLSLTSTDSIASIMLSLQMDDLPIDYLDTHAEEINRISAETILDVSKRLLNTSHITTVMVGNPENIEDMDIEKVSVLPNVE